VKLMFLRTAEGFTQPEIAAELEITSDAVSSAMRRYRLRLRQLRESLEREEDS